MRFLLVTILAACGGTSAPPPTEPTEPTQQPGMIAPTDEPPSPVELAAAPARKAPPPKPAAGGDAQVIVDSHNRYRAKHCAKPLAWSAELAKVAQKWADTLKAKNCMFGHSNDSKAGENLAAGTTGALPPETVVAMWYDEVAKYSFAKPAFSMETGHFTQVVWTTTTHVGCGMSQCKGMDIWVCNYSPPGNWEGKYREHVLPTSCKK